MKALKILMKILLAVLAFLVITFTVYFFNLDMKLTAAIAPWLDKYYDTVKRDRHL